MEQAFFSCQDGGKEALMAEIFECVNLRTPDGLNLYLRRDIPHRPRGIAVLLHSLGEHGGRYGAAAEKLSSAGYAVYRFDFRGHGRSDGPRGDVQSFQDYLSDVDAAVEHARKAFPALPLFLIGHSMGGLVAAAYAAEHPGSVDGEVTTGAAVRLMPALDFLKGCSRYSHGERGDERFSFVMPYWQEGGEAAWQEDSFMLDSVTIRLAGRVWIQGADWFAPRMKDVTTPLFILHGEEDCLVPPEASKWLYEGVSSQDRTLNLYPERGHILLGGDSDVLDDIAAWLDAHGRREGSSG